MGATRITKLNLQQQYLACHDIRPRPSELIQSQTGERYRGFVIKFAGEDEAYTDIETWSVRVDPETDEQPALLACRRRRWQAVSRAALSHFSLLSLLS